MSTQRNQLKVGRLYLEPSPVSSSKAVSILKITKAKNDNDYEWEEWAFKQEGGNLIKHYAKKGGHVG